MDNFSNFNQNNYWRNVNYPIQNTGFNIPMINDNLDAKERKENQDIFQQNNDYTQTSYQPIEYPDTDGGMDWNLITDTSPEELAKNNDIDSLENILKSFIKAKFTKSDSLIITHPLAQKLFSILQVAFTYLMDCQRNLQNELDKADSLNDILELRNRKKNAVIEQCRRKLDRPDAEKCIVCQRKFKNIEYLDKHFERRHHNLLSAYKSLRYGELVDYNNIKQEIDEFRVAIAESKKELERQAKKQLEKQKQVAPKVHPEQLRLMKKIKENQDMLIEKTKVKDDEHETFQQQMRIQLDEAVLALKMSHQRWEEQMNRKLQDERYRKPLVKQHTQQIEQHEVPVQYPKIMDITDDNVEVTNDLSRLLGVLEEASRPPIRKDNDTVVQVKGGELTVEGMKERQKDHEQMLAKITQNITEEVKKESDIKRVIEKKDDPLLARAKEFLERPRKEISPDEACSIQAKLKEQIMIDIERNKSELKNKRGTSAIPLWYVRSNLLIDDTAYIQIHDRWLMYVREQAPIDETDISRLFRDRDHYFPTVPPVVEGEKARKPAALMTKEEALEEQEQAAQNIVESAKRIPYSQRYLPTRGIYIPDDSDIEIIEGTTESSSKTVAYMDDPDYYKRRMQNNHTGFRRRKSDDEDSFRDITPKSRESSSAKIIPPTTVDLKELEVNAIDFASSDSEQAVKQAPKDEMILQSSESAGASRRHKRAPATQEQGNEGFLEAGDNHKRLVVETRVSSDDHNEGEARDKDKNLQDPKPNEKSTGNNQNEVSKPIPRPANRNNISDLISDSSIEKEVISNISSSDDI